MLFVARATNTTGELVVSAIIMNIAPALAGSERPLSLRYNIIRLFVTLRYVASC